MDLGVIMHKSAKPSRECAHVVSRKEAYLTVGIQKKIVNRVNDTTLRLYKCIVRPQLEYYIKGNHCHKPDMERLKKVRTRARCF